jgi:hypothetical protein
MDILLVGTLSLPKLLSENSLPTCDVQRHLALWKTFRGIVITVPGITIK